VEKKGKTASPLFTQKSLGTWGENVTTEMESGGWIKKGGSPPRWEKALRAKKTESMKKKRRRSHPGKRVSL